MQFPLDYFSLPHLFMSFCSLHLWDVPEQSSVLRKLRPSPQSFGQEWLSHLQGHQSLKRTWPHWPQTTRKIFGHIWGNSISWKVRKPIPFNMKVQIKSFEPNAAQPLSFWRRAETEILIWQSYKDFLSSDWEKDQLVKTKWKKQWRIMQNCSKIFKYLRPFPSLG